MLTEQFEHFYQFYGPFVGSRTNQNVNDSPTELLLWHWNLVIRMYRIQELMKEQKMEYPNGNKVVLHPVICPKLKSNSKFPVPECTPCLLARSKKI